ncbi:MAG: hypothetical protein NTV22_13555 [bacterium]|nr:hypothetical protein [bacterium]
MNNPNPVLAPDDAQLVGTLAACNQRGGRMLSLIDLLETGTVDLPLAAYLAALAQRGTSMLVGALPGGAGKTTVMCAVLNFLPRATAIAVLDSPRALASAASDLDCGRRCYLAHEIGPGRYYAYVWGAAAQTLFALAKTGHLIASNLHADTLEQTYDQLCGDNGVSRTHVLAVALKMFISIDGRQRRVARVYESNGRDEHLLWQHTAAGFVRVAPSRLVMQSEEARLQAVLTDLCARGVRTLAAVRAALGANARK